MRTHHADLSSDEAGASTEVNGNMQRLSVNERATNVRALNNAHFDVLVIGGGVTGAGVALDAATRGYSVALIEKSDFASGTSSKSTKLVHGGIRYLPNFDFKLVREALIERGLLIQNAPYLVSPIPFVLPIYEGDRHPVGIPFTTPRGMGIDRILGVGLSLYDGLAGKRNIGRHRHLSREQVLEDVPLLNPQGLKEGFVYYDAQTNDARLTIMLLRTAVRYGAVITNYMQATSFIKDEDGKLTGVRVLDKTNDQQVTVYARHIINATGIYADQIEMMTGEAPQIKVVPSKGVHLVLTKEKLQIGNNAVVLPETDDKRILFIVPWESRVIYGTTDTGSGDLDHPTASPEDISYLLDYLNRYLSTSFSANDIVSVYAGYRPLVKPANASGNTAKLSRSHVVLENEAGLVTITGGKVTTYRRMAQDTIDHISKRDGMEPVHPTESLPLLGSTAWTKVRDDQQQRGTRLGMSSEVIEHLGHCYGSEANSILDIVEQNPDAGQLLIPDLPYIQAEVAYTCRYEMALTPADVLSRRTSITLEDRQRGQGVVEKVADIMARELEWSTPQQRNLVKDYQERIAYDLQAESAHTPRTPYCEYNSTPQR